MYAEVLPAYFGRQGHRVESLDAKLKDLVIVLLQALFSESEVFDNRSRLVITT